MLNIPQILNTLLLTTQRILLSDDITSAFLVRICVYHIIEIYKLDKAIQAEVAYVIFSNYFG